MTRRLVLSAVLLAAAAATAAPAAAQGPQTFDRTKAPELGDAPRLTLPRAETARLSNGLELYVVPMREVPVVQATLIVPGGARRDGASPGLATFTAGMLDEGADTLDAFGIAAQAEYLGASLSTGADWDAMRVSLKAPKRTIDQALALMSAVALRPTFKAAEVQRQRDLRLAAILQQRDQPEVVADLAFNAILFPEGHPYHASIGGDSAATAALDSAAVRGFYDRAMRPQGARLIVTGDVSLAEARAAAERFFGKWTGRAEAAPAAPSAKPAAAATTVYLVDKKDAPQSVIVMGHAGVERGNPDYAALEVMNTILGGSFSSRLNSNLRETKGYTYGAGSGFQYAPLPGPFSAGAAVRADVTDSSLVEFRKELLAIRDKPVDAVELERAKKYLALGLASDFETASQMAGQIAGLLAFGLPLSYYDGYVQKVMAVTAADVQRVARTYVSPERMTIVVVGDVAKIRPGIEALKLGPVSVRDLHGNEVSQ